MSVQKHYFILLPKLLASLAALVAVLCVPALCQDEKEQQPDPRLASTRITLSANHAALGDLLQKASEQSKIQMSADAESKGWKVREMPVSIECKDMTVAAFQQQLALLLDLRWMRSGASPDFVYVLWQDKNAREREARALKEGEEEKTARAIDAWSSLADGYQDAMAGKAPEGDAFSEFARNNEFGQVYTGLISTLAPYAASSLASGQPFKASFRDLGPRSQGQARKYAEGMQWFASMMDPNYKRKDKVNYEQTTVQIMPIPEGPWNTQMQQLGFQGLIEIEGGGLDGMPIPIAAPGSPMATMMAETCNRIAAGENPMQVIEETVKGMENLVSSGALAKKTETAETTASDDPRLTKEVELKSGTAPDLVAALKPVSEATGLAIVGESWRQPGFTAPSIKGPAKEALDRLCKLVDYNWALGGSIVRVKSKNWALKRAAMVPRAEMERWKKLAEASPEGFELDQLAEVVQQFTSEQLKTIMEEEPSLSRYLFIVSLPDSREGLLFYASLTPGSRRSLEGPTGIAATRLTQAQRDSLDPLLANQGISPEQFFVPGAQVRLTNSERSSYLELTYPPDATKRIRLSVTMAAPPAPPASGPKQQSGQNGPQRGQGDPFGDG